MPELPEVETIRRGLEKYLVGLRIEDVEIRLPKQLSGDPKAIIGSVITGVRRFGKGLVIDLENSYSLAIHVKMTGQLIYKEERVPRVSKVSRVSKGVTFSPTVGGSLPNKYTHVIFELSAKGVEQSERAYLYYNDIRQFGWIKIVKTDEVSKLPFFKNLGPEPLNNLTIEQFSNIIKTRKLPIKSLLMDQKSISGIGNIYANDALYLAKIHPKRKANSLIAAEVRVLFAAIEQVLKKGIEVGGASEWQYVNALGEKGGYQHFFQVYGKVGKPCTRCGVRIEKITLGGRGTFFCPNCQKEF